MEVFKFGGASVRDAESVKNVSNIIQNYAKGRLIVIVSAMGKTTNAMEILVRTRSEKNAALYQKTLDDLKQKHYAIVDELFEGKSMLIAAELEAIFTELANKFDLPFSDNYDFEYDQMVSFGEIISTKIIGAYLASQSVDVQWCDARKLVRTSRTFRNADVEWETTEQLIQKCITDNPQKVIVTQGFIGHTPENLTTTLGREGSDYTAAVFAYCTNASSVTIWKDVPGMLNADPKYFKDTVKLDQISFKEAIELAYYGASVIHPKTIKPLQNKSIQLYVKSFNDPAAEGTLIDEDVTHDNHIPSYIFKENQVLISVIPTDFSFINEANLRQIFQILTDENVTINIMQNSAISFSFLVDGDKVRLQSLVSKLSENFKVKYIGGLELLTIRHYNYALIDQITKGKNRLLLQRDDFTIRIVLE